MSHLKSHSLCERDSTDPPRLGDDDPIEMRVQKLRELSSLPASSFSTDEGDSIPFDSFKYTVFVVMDGQLIVTVDLCLLGYHYIIKQ
jgi:hypothetical protein